MTRWYLAFAAFAAALAVASGQSVERCWGVWAAIGYATAAAVTAAAPRRQAPAAIALGCAVPVTAVTLAAARGWRFTAIPAVTTVAAMAAAAPAALSGPNALVQNAILFPLGLTSHRSPAACPLPGHLLATAGPAGKWAALALLAVATAAFAWWLARRPPRTIQAAAIRLAVTLAPAARWGYYAYPLALLGWVRLSRPPDRRSYSSERTLATPSPSASASSGADAVPASG